MDAWFLESCWIHNFTLQFPEENCFSCSFLARHSRIQWNFQRVPRIFDGVFIFSIFWINKINDSQSSSIIEFGLLDCPLLLFSLLSGFSNFWSTLEATLSQVW